jgi:MFS family permease
MLLTLLIGALLTGRLVDAVGAKYVLLAGTAILTIGLIGIWKADEHIHSA